MSAANDNRPYIYEIQPESGIANPASLPFVVVRRIVAIMDGSSVRGDLGQRYEHAFKTAITACVREQLITVKNNVISLTTKGLPIEIKYASTEAAITVPKMNKFTTWMKELAADNERKAKNA